MLRVTVRRGIGVTMKMKWDMITYISKQGGTTGEEYNLSSLTCT
ncbi:hypothetical protein BLGI_4517 [Brevibacillus laterosporus GI-9]|nr:hypothetical protein BLGI_4517 [Brevibacillus laterosporus GI-9]